MATVPITVNSVREQIREAIKMSLDTVGTPINTTDAWNKITTKASFPVSKAVYATSSLLEEYLGHRNMREDTLYVEVAPWCVDVDYELATSIILETYQPLFNTETVRAYMDPSYQGSLGKITCGDAELISTGLVNPYAVIRFTLTVNYVLVS